MSKFRYECLGHLNSRCNRVFPKPDWFAPVGLHLFMVSYFADLEKLFAVLEKIHQQSYNA